MRAAWPMGDCRTLCALAFALAWLGAPHAHAASDVDSIPAECGSRAAFDAALEKRLGPDASHRDVHVTIEPRAGGFHLSVRRGDEQRELDDPSCFELFRASVVIAATMLMQSHEPEPAPAPASSPPKEAPREASASPELGVDLGAGVDLGTLPKPVLALELEGKALWHRVGVSANVRYLLSADERDANQQGADLDALGAGVSGIFRPSQHWEARLGFATQRLSGRGIGENSRYKAAVWAAGPSLGLSYTPLRSGALWAGLGAEGRLNAVRGRFEIRNYSREVTDVPHVVYQVPWLAAAAFVRFGLVW
jgi:hypothetical protein